MANAFSNHSVLHAVFDKASGAIHIRFSGGGASNAYSMNSIARAVYDATNGAIHVTAPEFGGAGVPGIVPDPGTESGEYLKDDGTWDSPGVDLSGEVDIGPGGAGDSIINFKVNDSIAHIVGVDDSDGDSFKIAGAAGFETADNIVITTGGNIGFFGETPVAQQAYTAVSSPPTQAEVTAIRDALINLGLMAPS